MKKIFNRLPYMAAVLLMFSVSSCEPVIDEDLTDFGTGPNLVGFSAPSITLSAVTNGEEYTRSIPISIIGPTVGQLNDEVTVEVAVDEGSTATEGVHYVLPNNTITLTTAEDNSDVYVGSLPITIITDGLQAPLDETPVLNLTITQINTDGELVINEKTENVAVNLAYACPFNISDYTGTFVTTTDEFGIYPAGPTPFEVVAGPGENQITLVNFADHPEEYDLVIDVNPETGELTVPKQVALNTNNLGYTYGPLSMEGSGTSGAAGGSCIGEFGFTAAYTVAAGSFGQFELGFERVNDSEEEAPADENEE